MFRRYSTWESMVKMPVTANRDRGSTSHGLFSVSLGVHIGVVPPRLFAAATAATAALPPRLDEWPDLERSRRRRPRRRRRLLCSVWAVMAEAVGAMAERVGTSVRTQSDETKRAMGFGRECPPSPAPFRRRENSSLTHSSLSTHCVILCKIGPLFPVNRTGPKFEPQMTSMCEC